MAREIDKLALEEGLKWMPPELMIPIAARNENSIIKYIGDITKILVKGEPNKALLINFDAKPILNKIFAIWKLKESGILYKEQQVWVHVNYSGYRRTYKKAFPSVDLSNVVLDHIQNSLSMSARWDSILMWSHYSNKHIGFCIAFCERMIKESKLFRKGGLVKYENDFPLIEPGLRNSSA